ncbi:hypothetical protein Tco_1275435 [Tanacetum coccineum]
MTKITKVKGNASNVEIRIISSENVQNINTKPIVSPPSSTTSVEDPWSPVSDEDKEDKTKDEKFLMAKASNELRDRNWKMLFEHSVRRVTCGYPWPELEGNRFGMIQERLRSSAWCLSD